MGVIKNIKENVLSLRLAKICNNGLRFNTSVDRKEIKRILKYKNIGYNVFFKKRGSGATRFILVSSFIEAVNNKESEIIIVNKSLKEICKGFYKEDGLNVSSILEKEIRFYNGSKILFLSEDDIKEYNEYPDKIFIDNYNLVFGVKSSKILNKFMCPIIRVYRDNE